MVTLSTYETIRRYRRVLIVHSLLYYELDESIIPDWQFDQWCKELAELQNAHPEYSDDFDHYFANFDGSTGYHLANRTNLCLFAASIWRTMQTVQPGWTHPKISKPKPSRRRK